MYEVVAQEPCRGQMWQDIFSQTCYSTPGLRAVRQGSIDFQVLRIFARQFQKMGVHWGLKALKVKKRKEKKKRKSQKVREIGKITKRTEIEKLKKIKKNVGKEI